MHNGAGTRVNDCCNVLKYQLTQKMVAIIACAVHITFTFAVFIYVSVAGSLAAVIFFPIAIVAYVTFFLGIKMGNAKLFIPLLIYLVILAISLIAGISVCGTILHIREICHSSCSIGGGLNYPAALVLLTLDLFISLLVSWPMFVYYRFLQSEATKQPEVPSEPAVLRHAAYHAPRNTTNSIHGNEPIQHADPAALYDIVPCEGDPESRTPFDVMNSSSETGRSGMSQCTAPTQYSGDFSEVELEPYQPYNERAIN